MATSSEIKLRAKALAEKTDVNSISPQEVGGIMQDLASHSENVLRNGGTLGIRKVYVSVDAMEADRTAPVDFWGNPIKKGNLVVIYDGTTTGLDNNQIYAFMNPGWELATKLDAGYAMRAETEEKLSELGSEVSSNSTILKRAPIIHYGYAYNSKNGVFGQYELLDCTSLMDIKNNTFVLVNNSIYEIACFDKNKTFLGASTKNYLLEGTRYISISFLKENNIDYSGLEITTPDTYASLGDIEPMEYSIGLMSDIYNKISYNVLQDKSVEISISGSIIFHKYNGQGFKTDITGVYLLENYYSLFLDITEQKVIIDTTMNKQENRILLAYNDHGRIVSGMLANVLLWKETDKIKEDSYGYLPMFGATPRILFDKAHDEVNGNLINNTNCDTTDYLKVTNGTTYVFVNKPILAIECYDENKVHLGKIKSNIRATSLMEGTKYVTFSFLKTDEVDYSSLQILTNEDYYNTLISSKHGITPGIMFDKAFKDGTGELGIFKLLDCTQLMKVPGKRKIGNMLSFAEKFYTIACFDEQYNYLGYLLNGNKYLIENTTYFSISFLKEDAIDYSKLKIRIENKESDNIVIPQPKAGKKYYLFGDSITYWDSRTSWYDESVYMVAYPSYIRDVLGAEIINKGAPGNTANQITTNLLQTNLSDAYAVTYMAGSNDIQQGIEVGELGTLDRNTYIGNLEVGLQYVLTNYPEVKFYFIAPPYFKNRNITPYCEAMQKVAEAYSIPIIRWDLVGGINKINTDYFTVEGLHPNNKGHKLFADSLIPFLQNY